MSAKSVSAPHYVATCPGCAAERTVTRDRVATGVPVACEPCGGEMPIRNRGARPVKPPAPPESSAKLNFEAL